VSGGRDAQVSQISGGNPRRNSGRAGRLDIRYAEMPVDHVAPSKLVTLDHVTKRYGRARPWILRDVDVDVRPADVIEVAGPNGAGKSTLLRILAGATVPTRGSRRPAPRLTVGYVPERLAPPPPFSAAGYLRHHVRVRGLAADDGDRQVTALARALRFESLLGEALGALSKGSLQKVVVIAALLGQPRLVVLDEPFAGLDADARAMLTTLLADRVADGTAAIVFSDHREAGHRQPSNQQWTVGDREVHVTRAAIPPDDAGPTSPAGLPDARPDSPDPVRIAASPTTSDREIARLIARGWHILAVHDDGAGHVRIDAVGPPDDRCSP
jgi:ABC-type Mn2+/Zn2+ transport system ATPase subunit